MNSCDVVEPSVAVDKIIVRDSRLVFKNQEQLSNFLKEEKGNDFNAYKNKVRNFEKEGFKSLMPLFENDDMERFDEYIKFRQLERETAIKANVRQQMSELDITEDDIIADPHFATLLSEKREIEVGNNVYRYTDVGLFYTDVSNYDALNKVANAVQLEPCQLSSISGEVMLEDDVMVMLPNAITNCGGDGGSGGGCSNCGGSTSPPSYSLTIEEIRNNLQTCEWDPNIWDDIFGPAQRCTDYFENDKRIKVKTWSQNYGIFASTGVNVESQNRFAGIWWADKIDEIELGYTLIEFEYKIPSPTNWPRQNGYNYIYQHGDFRVDQYGRLISTLDPSPRQLFDKFPINDPDQRILEIYFFEPIITLFPNIGSYTVDGKDFNKWVQSMVKSGYSKMTSALNKQFNKNSAVIVAPSPDRTKIKFYFANWYSSKKDENAIRNIFDWNTAVIKWNSNSGTSLGSAPTSYRNYRAAVYGMGRRGNTWKGGKIILDDSQ